MRYTILNLIVAVAAAIESFAAKINNKAFDLAVSVDTEAHIHRYEQAADIESDADDRVSRLEAQLYQARLAVRDAERTADDIRATANERHGYAAFGSVL